MPDVPLSRRDSDAEDDKQGIEFYTAGKVDGGREALRRVREAIGKIDLPEEFRGYLPDGWEPAMGEVWRVIEDLEEKYKDPFYVAGIERPEGL